ncbi:hypothetical protein LTS07_006017 [Exophiala sideris]|uniref:GS catalytic domain-containing protein n=1 Tax=Exophiala sideris TaxID=1016849 RepID=A0ABR0J7G9_9EURO|nr:hypothetical protein LTS07_006017 [Exophiala sideris]KAK5058183.1 hypothetical protein LTR69_007181 [Exophiala sideris]KAK5182143.1 hypothetical protein LTR44_005744 [Eurotiomycetes sp. CCFEE 6388]
MADATTNPEELPLTFGIEIEMLFVLNEKKIRADPAYQNLLPEYFVKGAHDNLKEDLNQMVTDEIEANDVLSKTSAIKQAANILRDKDLDLAVHVEPYHINKKFDRWMLTTESHVLKPWNNGVLARWSDGRLQDCKPLSFHGLELISRILDAPSQHSKSESGSLSEVALYVNTIAEASSMDKPYQFISGPENAGVHVHIGLRPKDGQQVVMPINVLRHLAWIVVCFEDVISLLHHPERHGYKGTKITSRSNRTTFGTEQWVLHPSCEYLDMEVVFSEIFTKHGTYDDDLDNLTEIMCSTDEYPDGTKFWFVSFLNITQRPESPKITVEFRQHHGTFNTEDLKEWVMFVTALMRTAERKANEPKTKQWKEADGTSNVAVEEKAKYAGIFESIERRTLKELFDLMDLPRARREYWWERAKKFRNLVSNSGKDYNAMSSRCDLCGAHLQRDCAGWDEGELDLPPW